MKDFFSGLSSKKLFEKSLKASHGEDTNVINYGLLFRIYRISTAKSLAESCTRDPSLNCPWIINFDRGLRTSL